jgi:hypothetical protein
LIFSHFLSICQSFFFIVFVKFLSFDFPNEPYVLKQRTLTFVLLVWPVGYFYVPRIPRIHSNFT